MDDDKEKTYKSSLEYAKDSLGWKIPEDASSVLIKAIKEDLEASKKPIKSDLSSKKVKYVDFKAKKQENL